MRISIPRGAVKSTQVPIAELAAIIFQFQEVQLKVYFNRLRLGVKLLFQFQEVQLKGL